MAARHILALAAVVAAPDMARAQDAYPFVGVFSVLEAHSEQHFEMTKFLCLASFNLQRADGSYTAYHINTGMLGKNKVQFHPFETGTCDYSAAKKTEHCKVQKSNWGNYQYFVDYRGEAGGARVQASVSMREPGKITISNMRACPFDEARIKPFLSDQWLNYSDDDLGWTLYRHFPFNPKLAPDVAKALGIAK
jgi:hypothetical protein